MKKPILFLMIIHCTFIISFSQDEWTVQSSGTNSQLNDVFSLSYPYGWIAGNNGTLLYTCNNGVNWTRQSSGTSSNLYGLSARDFSSPRIAVGDNGTILMTTNYGTNWLALYSGVNATLRSAMYFSSTRIWVVGDNGTILRSTDNGANWIVLQPPNNADFKSVYYNGSVFVTGSNGVILKSTNIGTNWIIIPSGTFYNLNKFILYANSQGWIAGDHGTIMKTTDGGNSWVTVSSGTTADLLSITFSDSLHGWASGLNGKILRTTNGGDSWTDDLFGAINTINDIYFDNTYFGWAVGSNGLIACTRYGFKSIDALKLDANTISSWFTNLGNFNREPVVYNAGFEWPKGTGKTARYTSGPWLGAKVGNDTLVAIAYYSYEFLPGYTDNSGIPQGKDDPAYKVYKLTYGINNSDRQQWPNAWLGNSNQGAPVYFDNISNSWKPLDYADQTMFYSYTDSYSESHTNRAGSTSPLKADIKQVNFAFNEPGAMGNIQYCQYTIINRNAVPWSEAYFTIWSDDNIGFAGDDKIGCDTVLDIGYTYNGQPIDTIYGNDPPAVSFNVIKGPAIFTANNNDTTIVCNGKTKIVKVGYKHLGMTVFLLEGWWQFLEPRAYYETYRMMKGLTRDGNPIPNPIQGSTTFMFSGDPVTGVGWIDASSNDKRYMMSTGPFNMNPGDTQVIVIAQVIAQGTSNLNSISVLRQYAQIAKDNYYNCFSNVPIGIENTQNGVPAKFTLEQNYPNPFNPITKIRFSIPLLKGVRGMNVELTIYDILGREITTLVNREMKPGNYEVEWNGTNYASGVYFYKLEAGNFSKTKNMVLIK